MVNFPVRLIGGRRAQYVTFEGNHYIFSAKPDKRILYPVTALREAAPMFEGAICHEGHRQVLTEHRPIVGRIVAPFWDWASVSLLAMFEPATPEIEQRIFEAYPRQTPALSIDVKTDYRLVKGGNDIWVIRAIEKIYSVDFEESSFVGGGFCRLPEFKRATERQQISTNFQPITDRRMTEC